MAKLEIAIGAVADVATSGEVRESEDRLFGRLTAGRRRGVFRKVVGSVTIPANTYANGVESVINFGSPSDGRMWDIRAVTWAVVDYATAIPGIGEGVLNVSLMVGEAPKSITPVTLSNHPVPAQLVVPVLGTGETFNQTYPVLPEEEAYLYLSATGSTDIAADATYVAVLHVFETNTTAQIVGEL